MNILLEYLIITILVGIMNYVFYINNKKKYSKKNIPVELLYLNKIYGINIKKLNYGIIFPITNTFIITTIYIILMYLLNNMIVRIILGVILLILMIIICYGLLGKYYSWKEGEKDV